MQCHSIGIYSRFTQQCNVVFCVYADLCSLLAANSQFSILIGQKMQLTGCHNGNEMRNATCVDTKISIEWPYCSFLYCGNVVFCVYADLCSLLAANSQFSILIGQKMQLTGCHNGNEMRNATCVDTKISIEWPYCSFLYCGLTPGPFLRNYPWGGGVEKGPFGYDRRDQKIVGYADIVSIFIIE